MSDRRLNIGYLENAQSLKARAYDALKAAIADMDIYAPDAELKLDERELSARFGISRTPIREALAALDREGMVDIVPRRGVFIVRKSRTEILDAITVCAALESMSARLAVSAAGAEDLDELRALSRGDGAAVPYGYGETNTRFHRAIQRSGRNAIIDRVADGLFFHVRAIRVRAVWTDERHAHSVIEHRAIVSAIEEGDADAAERLVREHTLRLRDHIDETFAFN